MATDTTERSSSLAVNELIDWSKPFVLPPPTFLPRRYKPRNVGEWTGHLTFASELIAALEPALIVELGTHWGEAYFTFCQTVQERGLSTLCYAVDHWEGDEHAGHYGEEVFEEVSEYNNRLYRQFSYLLRRSFDEALLQFAEDSIDLLHIDGLHTYEAVNHDFENWLPKVKAGGVILLHDICPRHQDFGVWRLWDEIKADFPDTFEFHHSWGLGVVRKPGPPRRKAFLEVLFQGSPAVREEVRRHYAIYASHLEHILGRTPALSAPKVEVPSQVRVEAFPWINGGYSTEACQIHHATAGDWNTLLFELRDGNIGGGPLRVDPGCEPSVIEVGDIHVHSFESNMLLWSSLASAEARGLQAGGTSAFFPKSESVMINYGDDPQILLKLPPDIQGPLKLTISLKVVPSIKPFLETLHQQIGDLRQRLETAELERKSTMLEFDRMKTSLGDQVKYATSARDQAQSALESTRQALREAERAIADVQESASWRVTAPLRKFMAALRGARNQS